MSLVLLPADLLRVGEPTPFVLRDRTGILLAPRGMMVASEDQRLQLASRDLYVDQQDGAALHIAMARKLDEMVRRNSLLGQIARARPDPLDLDHVAKKVGGRVADPAAAWATMIIRGSAMLHCDHRAAVATRAAELAKALERLLDGEPDIDAALLLLIQGTSQDVHEYSIRHAMLVAVLGELAARHLTGWSDAWRQSLRCAALTMNVAMTKLQDDLARQPTPPSTKQRARIDAHAQMGAATLRTAGVEDELWLGAVEHHHGSPPGPLADLPPHLQLARLIQRADIFAARLSPRQGRPPLSAKAAARAAYLDERQAPDEAGSAIIKATGLYPPGTLVRLRNGEVAVVLRRASRTNETAVATVVNANGNAMGEPAPRDTRLPAYALTGSVAAHEAKVRINPAHLLRLV
jgi:HD-GYP domain-containing protein (c-di-GMP phosphodiesterase class II)